MVDYDDNCGIMVFWVAMRVQWTDVIGVLRFGGWARPFPVHFEECESC